MAGENDVIAMLVSEIRNRGGAEKDFYELGTPKAKILFGKVADLIVQETRNIYRVPIDYSLTITEMVAACNLDWANKDINDKNFPILPAKLKLGRTNVNVELFCFGKFMRHRREMLRELDSNGLRAGTLPELLAFGALYPNKQLEFPILEIGSVWPDRGGLRGVFLRKGKKERGLSVAWLKYGFAGYYRIIAVSKKSPI